VESTYYQCYSPDLWNFELAHAGTEEVAKPRFETRPGVEHDLRKNGIQSRRLSWLQASEGSSQLLRPKGFGDTVSLRCWNLPSVGQLLADQPGGLLVLGPMCPVLHELRGDGVCRVRALAKGASRPASKFVNGSPRLAARMREVDGIDSFFPSLLLLLPKRR